MIHIIFSTISFRNVTFRCGLRVDMWPERQVREVKELVEHAADVSRKNADPGERFVKLCHLWLGSFKGTNPLTNQGFHNQS